MKPQQTTPVRKKPSGVGIHHLMAAMLKGIYWGWLASLSVSVIIWGMDDYKEANHRLVEMTHAESGVLVTYEDTAIFAWVKDLQSDLTQTIQEGLDSDTVKTSAHQLKGLKESNSGGAFAPVFSGFAEMFHPLTQIVVRLWLMVENNTLMIMGKLILWALAIPMVILAWIFGVIDGLVRREVRAAEFGRESSFLFHHLIFLVPKVVLLLMVIYFVLPLWIDPVWFFVALSVLTLWLTSHSVAKFKKYV